MTKGNKEMKLELSEFKTIYASSADLKQKVNELQSEKRKIRLLMYAKERKINALILEIEKLEKRDIK